MTETPPHTKSALRVAGFALYWERSARVIWPAVFFPIAYITLALIGVWENLADPWRALALAGAVTATITFVLMGVFRGRWPRARDIRRRVEQDSALLHRPLETLADRPVSSDPEAQALWRAHQKRVRDNLEPLSASRPRSAYQSLDPYYLRFALIVVLATAAFVGREQWAQRLGDAFALEYVSNRPDTSVIDAWVTPPLYTGDPPEFLAGSTEPGAPITAPAGSIVTVRVVGANRRPYGGIGGADASVTFRFERDGPNAYEASAELTSDATIHLRRPKERSWVALISPDTPPTAQFVDEFGESPNNELTLSYVATDDHTGVTAELLLRRADTGEEKTLPLAAPNTTLDANTARVDLVKDAWAGLEVIAAVRVTDAIGQTGMTDERAVTLPQRLFLDPLAQAIAHERVVLLRDQTPYVSGPHIPGGGARLTQGGPLVDLGATRIERAPASVRRVYAALDLLQMGAERFTEDDQNGVVLALAYVQETLARAEDRAALAGVDDVLWHAAMGADGGDLSSARRAFDAARAALADALARGASAEEIERRVQAFKEAADRYMDLLYAEAILNENFADPNSGAPGGAAERSMSELDQMMQDLEDLSATGSIDDARRLLEQLGDQIANMETQINPQPGGGGGDRPPLPLENVENQQTLGELSDVIGEQRELADNTQEEALEGAQGQSSQELAEQQRQLADRLGELREELAEQGDQNLANSLGEAEEAMRDAARALELGDEVGASMDQGDALTSLRGAAEDYAAERLAERLGNIGEMSPEELERLAEQLGTDADGLAENLDTIDPNVVTDPFGRADNQWIEDTGGSPLLPDQIDIQRAREILDELRRRAGETQRSEEERDYIKRLLELF